MHGRLRISFSKQQLKGYPSYFRQNAENNGGELAPLSKCDQNYTQMNKKDSRPSCGKMLYCLLGIFLLMLSCSKDPDETTPDPPSNPDYIVPTIIPTGNEQYLKLKSDYIFDQEKLHTFELKLPAAALARIDANPTAEEYVAGTLIFQGDTISPIGIRYKGSVGAFVNCLSGTDWANPSGSKTCTKLSMKIKINWEGREEKFFKLKKLQFHSQNLDKSKMRERLGYSFFRAMGVPAPRSVHARLIINGTFSGLYALTEQIDGRFAKYNFEDDDGNLYKEVWPLNENGAPQADFVYRNALKTNEDDNPSVHIIKNFARDIASASPETLQSVISSSMDINEIISYVVVDRAIRHDDGPFHWYCNGGACTNHNYFWYEEPESEKLHLIPWDLDNAFENIGSSSNPVTPIADSWGETRSNCAPFTFGAFNLLQRSAACDKLTAGWASFDDLYEQLKTQFKAGALAEQQSNLQLEKWSAQIKEAVAEEADLHGDAVSISSWETQVEQLKWKLSIARVK